MSELHGPPAVGRGLDRVRARIRGLHLLAGCSRIVLLAVAVLVVLYGADRLLDLPLGVRVVLLSLTLAAVGREVWRRVLRPVVRGPDRLDAARLVETALHSYEGRLVSALQLPPGEPGSLERRVSEEAEQLCDRFDPTAVLTPKPALREAGRALGALGAFVLAVVIAQPEIGVFLSRWTLHSTPWPRDTHLALIVPERSPVHVVREDGVIVVSRGGVVNLSVEFEGKRPGRVEVVVLGEDGERASATTVGADGRFHGHVTSEAGDRELFVRGGDDDGDDHHVAMEVIDPPRLDDPEFVLEPPAYLAQEPSRVGSDGLAVAEGTRITVSGRPTGEAVEAALWLLGKGESIPLALTTDEQGQRLAGTFVAETSDTLSLVVTGAWGLSTPDPSHHALLVREDRPPALRVYAPARSDVKVTSKALVPFAVVAEDDHAVESVAWEAELAAPHVFVADAQRPTHHRFVLDLADLELDGSLAYSIEARDGRDLPGKGAQTVRLEGRRIDVVEDSELQRLLADRQLRLKESFQSLRDRQKRASQTVDDLTEDTPDADDPDLVAAAVAQNQMTNRLGREARELCAILEDTMTNRIDPGPGASAILERRLDDWRSQPVDEAFAAGPWRRLAADYGEGRFGRLDILGRQLDMTGLALELSEDLSPAAHELLAQARRDPSSELLAEARAAQARVEQVLDRLLERMEEWEDYQEVLTIIKTLIEDQKSLRARTQSALKDEPRQN